jgi:cell wall assembly regulator SMI1
MPRSPGADHALAPVAHASRIRGAPAAATRRYAVLEVAMRDAGAIWRTFGEWAARWQLPAPRVSASWLALPESLRPLAHGGWIERPMFEPPASAADLAALLMETGLPVPDDLRALYALHGGSFAPLLPFGMTLLPYAAMLTTWRFFATAGGGEDQPPPAPDGTHLWAAYDRRWLPLAESDSATMFLDFAPGPSGRRGQVLLPSNEAEYTVVAGSTTELIDRWLDLLADGTVRFDPRVGYPVPVGGDEASVLLDRA